MEYSSFHAYHKSIRLSEYTYGYKKFIPVFASSYIEIYPYQLAAAQFAMRSPYLKGAILCDEGSLGKTYEALLVITQMWYENKTNILVVVPTSLVGQWQNIIEEKFTIPFFTIDNNKIFDECLGNGNENPFNQDGIVLTTYNFAKEKHNCISQINWDLTVFEEAHHLSKIYKKENKGNLLIYNAVSNSFKLLLTATPIQNSIMDLYGLIYFIDDKILPDEEVFYNKYFRKPENYGELAEIASKYCFRTTKYQALSYIKIPNRIPITLKFGPSNIEKMLYELVDIYLQKDKKLAFPKMERYELTMLLYHTLASSSFAFKNMIKGVITRLEDMLKEDVHSERLRNELRQMQTIYKLADSINDDSKIRVFLDALKSCFKKLREVGANKKALVFTENKSTQKYIYNFLNEHGYKNKVLMFNGDFSRDYTIMEKFKNEADILVTTDVAAEGFNLEFCSLVVNYDLPYEVLTAEQRINRCHRQGQQSDVFVLSFINTENFADVRMIELINKRIRQFNGIIGLSDNIIGNFDLSLEEALNKARNIKDIDKEFTKTLEKYESYNKSLVKSAEESLFTTFSEDIANRVYISPQYIKSKIKELNDDLWYITKYFFSRFPEFSIDEKTRTISCFGPPPKVFDGSYLGRNEYSMQENYKPRSGRHTVTGSLAQRIIKQIKYDGINDKGAIFVNSSENVPSDIAYYEVEVKPNDSYMDETSFYTFCGKTKDKQILSNEECEKLMDLPIVKCQAFGEKFSQMDWWKGKEKSHHELDDLISPQEFINKAITRSSNAEKEEIVKLKQYVKNEKAKIHKNIDTLERDLHTLEKELENVSTLSEKLDLKKRISTVHKNYMQAKQNLFFDDMRLDQELEDKIQKITEKANLQANVKRLFKIEIIRNEE